MTNRMDSRIAQSEGRRAAAVNRRICRATVTVALPFQTLFENSAKAPREARLPAGKPDRASFQTRALTQMFWRRRSGRIKIPERDGRAF
jgi:hypothetical protein